MSSQKYFSLLLIPLSFLLSCKNNMEKGIAPTAKKVVPKMAITKDRPNEISKLSEYPFFEGKIAELKPAKNVYEYKLNNALFSDYSYKKDSSIFPRERKCPIAPRE